MAKKQNTKSTTPADQFIAECLLADQNLDLIVPNYGDEYYARREEVQAEIAAKNPDRIFVCHGVTPAPKMPVVDPEAGAEWDARAAKESPGSYDPDEGFVNAWASHIRQDEARAKAILARAGGQAWFLGLYKDGERVNAKLINGKFGKCWAFLGEGGKFTGEFLSHTNKVTLRCKLHKLGYQLRWELAPAAVVVEYNGTGLTSMVGAVATFNPRD